MPAMKHVRLVKRAAYGSGADEDPYNVLGVPRDADSQAVMRAYRRRLSENKFDDAAKARIEAAHSRIMMFALTSRLQGNVSVGREVRYADRMQIFPWRPRLFVAGRKFILYNAVIQALMLTYGYFNPTTTQPLIYAVMAGGVAQLLKQNAINPPPPEGSENSVSSGMKNVLRGFFLAFLATLLGCMLCYTIPDMVTSAAGIYLPIWFYEYQNLMLTIGTTIFQFIFAAFYR